MQRKLFVFGKLGYKLLLGMEFEMNYALFNSKCLQ